MGFRRQPNCRLFAAPNWTIFMAAPSAVVEARCAYKINFPIASWFSDTRVQVMKRTYYPGATFIGADMVSCDHGYAYNSLAFVRWLPLLAITGTRLRLWL